MKDLQEHIIQSETWAKFKSKMGISNIRVGDLLMLKHKIPFIPFYVGYSPRVNFLEQNFGWNELRNLCKREKIAFVRFDVPNVKCSDLDKTIVKKKLSILYKKCKKSPRETFAKWNVILDISKPEQELIESFSQKTRYNIRLASKKGAVVKLENSDEGVKIFYNLLKETSIRHKYYIHSEKYYSTLFSLLNKKNMANILVCYYQNTPLAAWFLINSQNTLYYPYGGSSELHKNIMASNLIAWEAIRLGKASGCEIFDMWGATNYKDNAWWGFTRFKLGYGGELVEYMNSYDFVVNKFIYVLFNSAYNTFWKLISIIRKVS